MKARILFLFLLLALIFSLNLKLETLKAESSPAGEGEGKEVELTPQKLLVESLGEFRYTLASYLWIQADHYHHEYEAHEDPMKNPPFLQLIRLITYLDPHFAQAYAVAGYDLGITFQKEKEAVDFLMEGIRYNPKDYELYFTLGFIRFHYREYPASLFPLEQAFSLAKDPIDRLNCARLLAHSFLKLEQSKAAQKYLKFILQQKPDDPWAKERINRRPNKE